MSAITIEKPLSTKLDNTQIKSFLENTLREYSDFDIELMNTYFKTKDIPLSEMTDI